MTSPESARLCEPHEHNADPVLAATADAELTSGNVQFSPEEITRACNDVRENINRQLDRLLGDNLESHFAMRSILKNMLYMKDPKENNG